MHIIISCLNIYKLDSGPQGVQGPQRPKADTGQYAVTKTKPLLSFDTRHQVECSLIMNRQQEQQLENQMNAQPFLKP